MLALVFGSHTVINICLISVNIWHTICAMHFIVLINEYDCIVLMMLILETTEIIHA